MPLPLPKFRELVFQLLYAQVVGESEPDLVVDLLAAELRCSRKEVLRAQERVRAILALRTEIDAQIRETSREYALDRIQTVEQNVLRLGVYELLYDEALPPKVAIAEAIRLAKKFSTPEAGTFINAVLDQLYLPQRAAL